MMPVYAENREAAVRAAHEDRSAQEEAQGEMDIWDRDGELDVQVTGPVTAAGGAGVDAVVVAGRLDRPEDHDFDLAEALERERAEAHEAEMLAKNYGLFGGDR